MKILGISAYYHDSAAALVVNGEIIAAAQEERFTRKKHDPSFPHNAIKYCLREGKINSLNELDWIVFYEKPFTKLERIIWNYYIVAPAGFEQFRAAVRSLLFDKKLFLKDLLVEELKKISANLDVEKLLFCEHHLSHAASAFYPSPFKEAAILTVDGVGEWATSTLGLGREAEITILKELNYPNSLGLLYSAFTYYCGFKVNSGEYKLMGLAPYGDSNSEFYKKCLNIIMTELVEIKEDGSIRLNLEYFNFHKGLTMTDNEKWIKLFGISPRSPDEDLRQEYCDMALAIQRVTEEIIFKMAKEVKRLTGSNNLCMAGGVALNCVANGKLLREKLFENLWIQPAAGDAGGALGAALACYFLQKGKRDLKTNDMDMMKGSYLGPCYSRYDILEVLGKYKAPFEEILDEDELCERVARLIADGHVVGWFQGRMEWGPRALGNRSILADARNPEMQKKLNLKIKFREGFRPFAPAVLAEEVKEHFECGFISPYMLLIDWLKPEKRTKLPENYTRLSWNEKLYYIRSHLPAITHIDFTARVQTVHKDTNPRFYKLLKKFKELTGVGVLINTSFNVRGEPIVCSPEDAYLCFMRTEMDYLVLENFILDKREQPKIDMEEKLYAVHFEPD